MKDEQPKMTTYEIPGVYGESDLTSTYPYSSDEWSTTFHSAFPDVNEKEYLAKPQKYADRVHKKNADYIAQLKKEGRYLKPFVTKLSMMHNPLFDIQHPTQKPALESYRMTFIDTSGERVAIDDPERGVLSTLKPENKRPYVRVNMDAIPKVPIDEMPRRTGYHVLKTTAIKLNPENVAKGLADGSIVEADDKKFLVLKDRNGKPTMWANFEEWTHMRKFFEMKEWILNQVMWYKVPYSEELNKKAHELFGIEYKEPEPVRLGNFFMAYVGDDRKTKMLWQDADGKVYDFKEGSHHPDAANVDTKEFTEKWTFWRGVSGFDF